MSLTTREVADLLHVSATTVTRTYAATRIPAAKVGRQWLFEREDVDHFLASRRVESRPRPGRPSTRSRAGTSRRTAPSC